MQHVTMNPRPWTLQCNLKDVLAGDNLDSDVSAVLSVLLGRGLANVTVGANITVFLPSTKALLAAGQALYPGADASSIDNLLESVASQEAVLSKVQAALPPRAACPSACGS